MFYRSCVVVLASVISACASTVHVDRDVSTTSTEKVEGIPFYIKKQQHEHATVYAATWLSATLTVKIYIGVPSKTNDKAFETVAYNKQVAKSQAALLDDIRRAILATNGGTPETAKRIIDEFLRLPASGGEADAATALASNNVSRQWVVDGSQKYYLNAPLPWFGTASLTQKLNADGTISEVVSAPDTKLAEGFSTLIPFKEYLTGRYVDTLSGQTDTAVSKSLSTMEIPEDFPFEATVLENRDKATEVYVLSLATEETGYEYTFTRVSDLKPADTTPIPFDTRRELFTRKPIMSTGSKDAKKDTSPKIGISGEVKLPEGWGKPAS